MVKKIGSWFFLKWAYLCVSIKDVRKMCPYKNEKSIIMNDLHLECTKVIDQGWMSFKWFSNEFSHKTLKDFLFEIFYILQHLW